MLKLVLLLVLTASGVLANSLKGPWDKFNYAPKSKTVWPAAIHSTQGSVTNTKKLVHNAGTATLTGNGSWVALDFGVEVMVQEYHAPFSHSRTVQVGGLISLNFHNPQPSAAIALSFTESPLFISPTTSDDSSYPAPNSSYDGILAVPAPLPSGYWTQPAGALRGGFRYLTIVSNSPEPVTISNVSCAISFMPHVEDMRDYKGYFYAKDPVFHDEDFLNKLWYAGAYTVQTNTVPLNTGRMVPIVKSPGMISHYTIK